MILFAPVIVNRDSFKQDKTKIIIIELYVHIYIQVTYVCYLIHNKWLTLTDMLLYVCVLVSRSFKQVVSTSKNNMCEHDFFHMWAYIYIRKKIIIK